MEEDAVGWVGIGFYLLNKRDGKIITWYYWRLNWTQGRLGFPIYSIGLEGFLNNQGRRI